MATTEVQRQPDTPFDLTILYMEDARSWCEYLFDIFQPYEVYQNSEEITNFPTHETTLNNIKDSRVVIVIVSPVFLDNIDPHLDEYTDQVVALLCGVPVEDLKQIETTVPSSKDWQVVEALSGQRNITQVTLKLLDGMESDTEDGGDYLTMTGRHLEPEKTYPEPLDDIYLPMNRGNIEEPEDEYTTMGELGVSPEDVYEPMTTSLPADTYEIIPSGTGPRMPHPGKGPRKPPGMRAHEFAPKGVAYANDSVQSKTQYSEGIYITPSTIRTGTSEPLFIIFTTLQISNRHEDLYKAFFKCSNGTFNEIARYVNPHTLRVNRLPEAIASGSITVDILHNDNKIAALKLNVQGPMDLMSDLLRTITNPYEFMCEALNISPADTNSLDRTLFEHCKRHMPQEGENVSRILLTSQETKYDEKTSEVPTVLHFAAKYGLTQICMMLLDFPGANQAMKMKNCDGDTPSGLAEKSGFEDLKNFLENYLDLAGSEGIQHPEEIGQKGTLDASYVSMTGKNTNPQYMNKAGMISGMKKSDYDRPFPVAIPAASSPFMRDDTIKSLVSSGNESDIYDYYDNQSWTNFEREEDDDDDDNGQDYEHLEEQNDNMPPSRLPPKPTTVPIVPREDFQVMGKVRITPMEELNRTPKSNPGAGIPKDQQTLIDLQNMVRENKISVDDAVEQFKDLQRQDQLSARQSVTVSNKPNAPRMFNFFRGKKDQEMPAVRSLLSSLRDNTVMSGTNTGGTAPSLSPRQNRAGDRFNQQEEPNRPTSTLSTGSRNSTVSTGSRDSSYGSAAEIDDSETDTTGVPAVVKRQMGEGRKSAKTPAPTPPGPAASTASGFSTPRQESFDDLPLREAPPPPASSRRTSDPSSPSPPPPQKPKPQPRRTKPDNR